MSTVKSICLGVASFFVAGCVAPNLPVGVPPSDFGNAVSQNVATETVNPTAPIDKGPISVNAERAALELDRYDNDMVKQPANIGTGVQIGGAAMGSNGSGGGTSAAGTTGAPAAQ